MPAYISHAIMGKNLYDELVNNKLLEIELNTDEIKGYSLGIDLSKFSHHLSSDPHNDSTRDFFLYMINYIKKNNLYQNKHAISLLYGHIAHYFLDINIHPYVNYLTDNTKQYGVISNHHLIEGYINSYLAREIINENRLNINETYFNQIDLTEESVKNLLRDTYRILYKEPNIIIAYKKVMAAFSGIEKAIKLSKIKEKTLVTLSGFKTFMKKNNITESDLINEFHKPYYGMDKKEENLSLLDMYNKSLVEAIYAIYEVNKILYKDKDRDILNAVFEDISYDTGISCQKTKILTLKRRRNQT